MLTGNMKNGMGSGMYSSPRSKPRVEIHWKEEKGGTTRTLEVYDRQLDIPLEEFFSLLKTNYGK